MTHLGLPQKWCRDPQDTDTFPPEVTSECSGHCSPRAFHWPGNHGLAALAQTQNPSLGKTMEFYHHSHCSTAMVFSRHFEVANRRIAQTFGSQVLTAVRPGMPWLQKWVYHKVCSICSKNREIVKNLAGHKIWPLGRMEEYNMQVLSTI